jgi:DNA adenine methylase
MRKIKPPIKYFGGKSNMADKIISQFPANTSYNTYIEPFSGAYNVGLQMPYVPSIEIYNDLEKNVYSLYKVLSDKILFNEFKYKCDLIYYSKELREEFKANLKKENLSIVDRAFYFFYVNRTSHNGIGGWSENLVVRRNMSKSVSDFLSVIDRLPQFHQRLSKIMILNTNGIELIKKYDRENTFFYCVPENEIITLLGGVGKKIQEICVGDNASQDNKIVTVHKRYTDNEKLIKINVMGLGRSNGITVSQDHVLFVYRNNEILEIKASKITNNDYLIISPNLIRNNNSTINFTQHVNKCGSGNRKELIYNDDLIELCELLGFYAAEGHSQNGLFLSFNINELKYLDRTKYLIKSVFGIDAHIFHNSPHPTVSQTRVYSRNVEKFFKDFLINGNAHTKEFTPFIMGLSKEHHIEILKSWLRGDGGIYHVSKVDFNPEAKFTRSGKRNKFKITGTSSSLKMIMQLYQMALNCNLHPSVKKRENAYDLYFTCKDDVELITNIKTNGRCCKRRHWIDNETMIAPITKIEILNYTGNMYDLTTEKGYYFLNFNVKSHNCDPPYHQSTRTAARYDVDMNDEQQEKFIDTVINVKKAKLLISGYDCPLYEKLLSNGFTKHSFIVNTVDGKRNPKKKVENLWRNY